MCRCGVVYVSIATITRTRLRVDDVWWFAIGVTHWRISRKVVLSVGLEPTSACVRDKASPSKFTEQKSTSPLRWIRTTKTPTTVASRKGRQSVNGWCPRLELNQRPLSYRESRLPLTYRGFTRSLLIHLRNDQQSARKPDGHFTSIEVHTTILDFCYCTY